MLTNDHRTTHGPRRHTRNALGGLVTALSLTAAGALVALAAAPASATEPVGLGSAASFAVLAGSGITNTGATTIVGDVGTFPTPSETGFGSLTMTGTNHDGDTVTQGAKTDLVAAYDDAAGRGPAAAQTTELGGARLTAGVYRSPTFGLTGTVTLDAAGDPNAEFVFQTEATLITASDSHVALLNGADACHVVWQVGSSATFGTGSAFAGDVLALTSITAQHGATFDGRLLARNGAVTLDNNSIRTTGCASTPTGTATTPGTGTTATSTPAAGGTPTTGAPGATAGSAATSTSSATSAPAPAAPAARTATQAAGGTGLTATGRSTGAASPSPSADQSQAGAAPFVPALTETETARASGSGQVTTGTPLAYTGAHVGWLLVLGLGLLLMGSASLLQGRRLRAAASNVR